METVRDFIFLGSKITANGDCRFHDVKGIHQGSPPPGSLEGQLAAPALGTFWLEVSRKAGGTVSEEVPLTQQKLRGSGPVCLEFHTQERIWEGLHGHLLDWNGRGL